MKNRNIILFVALGMIIGMVVQCIYDVKHQTTQTIEKVVNDTIVVTDTVFNTTTITKYQPQPRRVEYKLDTLYLQGSETPYYSVKTHKVYIDTIDTLKTLTDTLKYRQSINYYITTTDKDVDTIKIQTNEEIPLITRTISELKYVKNIPTWTLNAGIGVGVTPKGDIQPTIGITFGYTLWSKNKR